VRAATTARGPARPEMISTSATERRL
jgi:hypothetical protein